MSFIMNENITVDTNYYRVKEVQYLTPETFIIRLPQSRFSFKAGQHITLAIKGDYQSREYSIYSGENDGYFEVLVKEVEGGYFSPKLKTLKKGDVVEVHGPFGKFGIEEKYKNTSKHVFLASGTGVAPFHSIIKSYTEIDYQLIHGVRYHKESYGKEDYKRDNYVLCTSRDNKGNFSGRLTDYLQQTDFDKDTIFYLCGNSDMIFDAMEILKEKGFGRDEINCEVYF